MSEAAICIIRRCSAAISVTRQPVLRAALIRLGLNLRPAGARPFSPIHTCHRTAGGGFYDNCILVCTRGGTVAIRGDGCCKKPAWFRQREPACLAAGPTRIPPARQQCATQQLRGFPPVRRSSDHCDLSADAAAHGKWSRRWIRFGASALHRLLYH